MPNRKNKQAAPDAISHWVSSAWKNILEQMINQSFKKRCISNVHYGTEDDMLRNNAK